MKPLTMFGIAYFFFYVVFSSLIPPELAIIVGVLVEVPVMLALVKIANNTKGWFSS